MNKFDTLYKKIGKRYVPYGVCYDRLSEGLWIVHKNKSSISTTSVDYLRDRFTVAHTKLDSPLMYEISKLKDKSVLSDIISSSIHEFNREQKSISQLSDYIINNIETYLNENRNIKAE